MAHCPSCHETFSTTKNFEDHRTWAKPYRGCTKPDQCGMIQNQKGTWMRHDERDVSRLGLLRHKAQGEHKVADDPLSEPGA